MRIAHLADTHIGMRQYGRTTSTGVNAREADVAKAFQLTVTDIIEQSPDVVLMAGDLFHQVRPTNRAIRLAFDEFSRLAEVAPILLIAGNHDAPRSAETGSILPLLERIPGLQVATSRPKTFDVHGLRIVAMPHAALMAREPIPDGDLLMAHGEVQGLFRDCMEPGGAPLDEEALARWQYVALGHYHVCHEPQPNVWYSGSTEWVSSNPWGELAEGAELGREGKGWLLVDDGDVTFRPIPTRRFLDVQVPGESDVMATLHERLIDITDVCVRVKITDLEKSAERDLDYEQIREWKRQAFHLHLDIRRAKTATSQTFAPGRSLDELVREALQNREGISADVKARMITLADEVLARADEDAA